MSVNQGGGGGLGCKSSLISERIAKLIPIVLKNVTMTNFTVSGITGTPFAISQCTTFSGTAGNCSSSLFQLEDMLFQQVTGTAKANPIASLQCSANAPCTNIGIENVALVGAFL